MTLQQWMPVILDVAVVLLFLVYIRKGMRLGFVRSMLHLVGGFASMFVAAMLSSRAAAWLYENYIYGPISQGLLNAVGNLTTSDELVAAAVGGVSSLPQIVQNALHFDTANLTGQLTEMAQSTAAEVVQGLMTAMIGPAVLMLIRTVLFFILFALCMVVVKLISRMLGGIDAVPLVGGVNSALGALAGGLETVWVLTLLTCVLNLLMAATNDALPYLTRAAVQSTFLLRFFWEHNLILALFA